MHKIGVIGDKSSIRGFLALGMDIFPSYKEDEIRDNLRKCAKSGYAVIYITERALSLAADEAEKYNDMPVPAIIPIPGNSGNIGIGMENVKKFVERAVGSDILGD